MVWAGVGIGEIWGLGFELGLGEVGLVWGELGLGKFGVRLGVNPGSEESWSCI